VAAGLASRALMMAIWCAAGVLLIRLMRRHRATGTPAVQRAAAAAASSHTIPVEPVATPIHA